MAQLRRSADLPTFLKILAIAFVFAIWCPLPAAAQRPQPFPSPIPPPPVEPLPTPSADIFPLSTVWTTRLDAPPALAPAFEGDRAFVVLKPTVQDGGQKEGARLVAVALSNGATLWQREIGKVTSLAAGGGLVFACSGPLVQAFDQSDGHPRWEAPLDAPLAAPLHSAEGWLIAVTQGSQAFAVRMSDGQKVWQAHLPSPATGEAALRQDRVYVPLTDDRVVALNVESGAVVWDEKILSQPTTLLALDDRVFVGTGERWFYALQPATGRVLWRVRVGSAIVGTPVVDRSTVYFLALDNLLRALQRSGGSLVWRQVLARRARFGPFAAGHLLFVSGLSPSIQAYKIEPAARGALAGSFDAPDDLLAPIHVVPGLVERDFLVVAITGQGNMVAERPKSLDPEPFALSPLTALLAGFPRWIY